MSKQILFFCLASTFISSTNGQDTVSTKLNQTGDTAVFRSALSSNDSGRNVAKIDSTKYQPTISDSINITGNKNGTPYATSFKKDAPVIIAGVGLTALGAALIRNKKDLTMDELSGKTRDKVPFFDRGNVGYYSQKADKDSYVPFHISFGLPILTLLLDNKERSHFGQVLVLYTETMAITGALFTMAAGTVQRSRPFVYGTEAPLYQRLSGNNQRSFFAGHTAATAAATFFTAKVFQDFHPHSTLNPFIWIVAGSVPAVVGYLRYKAGMHFLSDNIIGYLVGAGTGILVPQWHKIKALKNVNISAQSGKGGYQEILLSWRF